jgi:hypothetical protein
MAVRSLRESERQRAYDVARKWTAGKEVELRERTNQPSKYPPQVVGLVLVLCVLLLIAAFIPSALRLHEAGTEEFCRGVETVTLSCEVVGISAVAIAETGSLVFILALSVVEATSVVIVRGYQINVVRTLLWMCAIMSGVVSVVGNATIGTPWVSQKVFDYLIVFVPPALVLAVGYILKDFLLHAIQARRESAQEYTEKTAIRDALLEDPEKSDRWLRYYSRALKEAIQAANRNRQDELEELTRSDWEQLILREMHEASWSVDPTRVVAQVEARVAVTTPVSEEDVWQNEDGTWSARLPGTDTVIGRKYAQSTYAKMAIAAKLRSLNGGN